MNELKIILYGRIPSKKNSKNIIQRGNRKFLVPSENYKLWHEEQSWQLAKYRQKIPIEKCKVKMVFFPPDNRKTDLTNKAESVMDLLVDNRIIIDDNWFVCDYIELARADTDIKNPKVEVYIYY